MGESETITFEMLHSLIGRLVEVSPKFNKSYGNNPTYYDEQEFVDAYPEYIGRLIPGQDRLRGRLGVFYRGESPKPVYLIECPRVYSNGLQTDRHVEFEWIETSDALRAMHLKVLD